MQISQRQTIRSAQAMTAAGNDDLANTHPALASAVAFLRNALISQRSRRAASNVPRHPRPETKRAKVLGVLHRPEGTNVAQVADTTGLGPAHRARLLHGPEKGGLAARDAGARALGRPRQAGYRW